MLVTVVRHQNEQHSSGIVLVINCWSGLFRPDDSPNHSSGAISMVGLCFFFSPLSNSRQLGIASYLSYTAADRTGLRKLQSDLSGKRSRTLSGGLRRFIC